MKIVYIGSGLSSLAAFLAFNKNYKPKKQIIYGDKISVIKDFIFDVHYSPQLYDFFNELNLIKNVYLKKIAIDIDNKVVPFNKIEKSIQIKIIQEHSKKTWSKLFLDYKAKKSTIIKDEYAVIQLKKNWQEKIIKKFEIESYFQKRKFIKMSQIKKIAQNSDITFSSLSTNTFLGKWKKIIVSKLESKLKNNYDIIYFPFSEDVSRIWKKENNWYVEYFSDSNKGVDAYPVKNIYPMFYDKYNINYVGRYATGSKQLFSDIFQKIMDGEIYYERKI